MPVSSEIFKLGTQNDIGERDTGVGLALTPTLKLIEFETVDNITSSLHWIEMVSASDWYISSKEVAFEHMLPVKAHQPFIFRLIQNPTKFYIRGSGSQILIPYPVYR